jgi:murein L,D-transpeptidase YcbB/YkuD
MRCRLIYLLLIVLFIAGCASAGRHSGDMRVQRLQEEAAKLKEDIRQKDEKISYLEGRINKIQSQKINQGREEKMAFKKPQEPAADSARMTPKEIQAALKKAGFYKGAVDGRIEQETRKAVSDFQKANGLKADGIAGKQTCLKLRKYSQ